MADFDSPEILRALDAIERKDFSAAFDLLVPLAQADNPKAQCNLATLYHFGWGVQADGRKAVELYTKVAERDIREEYLSAVANQNLAAIYIVGLTGIQPDPDKARFYSKRAKDLGFPMSYPSQT